MNLEKYGWNEEFERWFRQLAGDGRQPGRVIVEHKGMYGLLTETDQLQGEVSGKFRYGAAGIDAFPAVGDWVVMERRPGGDMATIHSILPRKSRFSRKVAGALTQEQVLAANFDHVFIINSLNRDFNLRRLERYLTMAWESGACPVIVLTKKDLCTEAVERVREVEAIAFGVPVHAVSAVTGEGMEQLEAYLKPGSTVVFLGSSGVGKSTLTNQLAGREIMDVNGIREDDSRGRHTTTSRQLALLPGGGLVIDTPGIRELQLWDADEGLQGAFGDIDSIAEGCRFKDCRHESEPGCAVKESIKAGLLPIERLDSYRKLQKELVFLESKQNQAVRLASKKNEKLLSKYVKSIRQ